VVDEPANESKAWLNRFEDKLDQVVDLLRDLKSGPADGATATDTTDHVRLRLNALAARLRLMERRRRD
jgi:hypothetical protein